MGEAEDDFADFVFVVELEAEGGDGVDDEAFGADSAADGEDFGEDAVDVELCGLEGVLFGGGGAGAGGGAVDHGEDVVGFEFLDVPAESKHVGADVFG